MLQVTSDSRTLPSVRMPPDKLCLEQKCLDVPVHDMVKGVPASNLLNALLHKQVSI